MIITMPILAFAFAFCAGRCVRSYQQLQRDKARLQEIQAQMDMSKPGAYLEWLSK